MISTDTTICSSAGKARSHAPSGSTPHPRPLSIALALLLWLCPTITAQHVAVDPAGVPALQGGAPGDGYGQSCAVLPDMDNDGVAEILVGAPRAIPGGYVRLVSGASRLPLAVLSPGSALPDFGRVLARVADVDGDGREDFAVAAPGMATVQVFSSTVPPVLRLHLAQPALPGFGTSIATTSDRDQDGIRDVLVGAPGANGGAGAVVLLGSVSGLILRTIAPPPIAQGFGGAVASRLDLDSDGTEDYVIGAPEEPVATRTAAGAVYVVSGRTGLFIRATGSTSDQFATGTAANARLGADVAVLGDVNGDGTGDFAAAAVGPYVHSLPQSTASNVVIVFSGRTRTRMYSLSGTGGFGTRIAPAGDLNGDGWLEFAVGAPSLDQGGMSGCGGVFVFDGSSGDRLCFLEGSASRAAMGTTLAAGADLDADGWPDLVVGSPQNASGTGSVLALGIRPTRLAPQLALPAYGTLGATTDVDMTFPGVANGTPYVVLVSRGLMPLRVGNLLIEPDLVDPLLPIFLSVPAHGSAAGTSLYWAGSVGLTNNGVRGRFSLRLPANWGLEHTLLVQPVAVGAAGDAVLSAEGTRAIHTGAAFVPSQAYFEVSQAGGQVAELSMRSLGSGALLPIPSLPAGVAVSCTPLAAGIAVSPSGVITAAASPGIARDALVPVAVATTAAGQTTTHTVWVRRRELDPRFWTGEYEIQAIGHWSPPQPTCQSLIGGVLIVKKAKVSTAGRGSQIVAGGILREGPTTYRRQHPCAVNWTATQVWVQFCIDWFSFQDCYCNWQASASVVFVRGAPSAVSMSLSGGVGGCNGGGSVTCGPNQVQGSAWPIFVTRSPVGCVYQRY